LARLIGAIGEPSTVLQSASPGGANGRSNAGPKKSALPLGVPLEAVAWALAWWPDDENRCLVEANVALLVLRPANRQRLTSRQSAKCSAKALFLCRLVFAASDLMLRSLENLPHAES